MTPRMPRYSSFDALSLLISPTQVANMYLQNKTQFDSTARFWTDCYALPKDGSSAGSVSAPRRRLVSLA